VFKYGFDQGNIGGIMELKSFEKSFGMLDAEQDFIDNRKVRAAPHLVDVPNSNE
jgi:hypothetical protein